MRLNFFSFRRASFEFGSFIAALIALVFGLNAPAAQAGERLSLVYVSNMPDIEDREDGSLGAVATLIERKQANEGVVLFVHGGDSLAPSTLASFDRGSHMIDILNAMDTSVMAVAKREFAFYEDELTLRAYEAAFPLISANIFDPLTGKNLEGIENSHVVNVGEKQVGFVSILSPEVIVDYVPKRIKVNDPIEAFRDEVKNLRANGVDFIVGMADYYNDDFPALFDEGLFDVFIVADRTLEKEVHTTDQGTYVAYPTNIREAVVIDVEINGQHVVLDAAFAPLKDVPPKPEITAIIDSYMQQLSQLMDTVVGKTLTPLDTQREAVRSAENAFGNMVADAVRDRVGTDIAMINGGGIRGNKLYDAGTELRRRDIQGELPFRNYISVVKVTGAQLLEALENGFSQIEERKGKFPHLSGMSVLVDANGPVGKRVREAKVRGKPINPDETYIMAVPDFVANGGDGYDSLSKGELVSTHLNLLMYDAVRTYVSEKGEIAPKIEGRLKFVSE